MANSKKPSKTPSKAKGSLNASISKKTSSPSNPRRSGPTKSKSVSKKTPSASQPRKQVTKRISTSNKSKAAGQKSPKRTPPHRLRNLLILLLIVGTGSVGGLWYYRTLTHQKLLQPGLEYLTAQENIDFTQISSKVDERNRADAMTRISNPDDIMSMWSLFKNTILMGDSRVYGFMSYGFLPENQVLAAAGYTINNIPDFEDTIAAQQPRVIYFSYGVNDMGLNIGANEGENGYQAVYERNIKALLEKSPNSKIFVNSIIEPTPEALAKNPNWNKVDDFNRQIKEMCERNGWTYVDNSALSAGGTAPIYASDGVHFFSTFYEEWAKNMLTAQYQSV